MAVRQKGCSHWPVSALAVETHVGPRDDGRDRRRKSTWQAFLDLRCMYSDAENRLDWR